VTKSSLLESNYKRKLNYGRGKQADRKTRINSD
jgi:hypothetical protein